MTFPRPLAPSLVGFSNIASFAHCLSVWRTPPVQVHLHSEKVQAKPVLCHTCVPRQASGPCIRPASCAGKVVDNTGVLAPLAPVTSVLDETPLMPSGAALFVSAMVMLLDFSRPKWQPVTSQAKDFVVRCLDMCAPFCGPRGSFHGPAVT